jgi:FkbM family methyltransferase
MKKIVRRFAIVRAVFKRVIGWRDGLLLLLPSGWLVKIAGSMRPQSIRLLGREFRMVPENYLEALDLIDTIIALDQYRAAGLLTDRSVVIDAGANIGAFSVFAGSLTPHGSVYAFEPDPRAFGLLEKNIASYLNIRGYNIGLGDVSKRRKLYSLSHDTFNTTYEDSGRVEIVRSKGPVTAVDSQITTIDEFVAQQNINRVDFIKIDTEGYEAKVIEGARDTIKKHRPIIVMAGYHHSDDVAVLPSLVDSIVENYRCSIEDRGDLTLFCVPC